MGRHLVTFVFMVLAAAVGREALAATGDALRDGELATWLIVGYSVIKLAVAVAFTYFVIVRSPPLRRARKSVAVLTGVAVLVPAILKAPSEAAAPGLVIVGELIAVGGCAWMLVAALALGRCFGVLPEARGLVTHGPYRLVRHPLYLGEFAAVSGLLVASPSPRNLAAGALFGAAQLMRMGFEERALTREFPEYADYAARTPRVVPSLGAIWPGSRVPVGESGQAMVEYSLILGLVAAVVALTLTPLGAAIDALIGPVLGGF